jgi:hypothetical protein
LIRFDRLLATQESIELSLVREQPPLIGKNATLIREDCPLIRQHAFVGHVTLLG